MNKEFYIKCVKDEVELAKRAIKAFPSQKREGEIIHSARLSMVLKIAARDTDISFNDYLEISLENKLVRRLLKEAFSYETH